jgi:hypothetical protein
MLSTQQAWSFSFSAIYYSPPAYKGLSYSEYVIFFIKPDYEIFDYLDIFKLAQTMTAKLRK